MSQRQRLSALQVRIARNQGVEMLMGMAEQGPLKAAQQLIDAINVLTQPQAQIRPHLIVAAATGVELLAQRTELFDQAALNGEMNIFSFQTWIERTSSSEHARMGHRTVEVLLQQSNIKTNRGIEALDGGMQPLLETITPTAAGAPGDTV